jgi:hypothetical protein
MPTSTIERLPSAASTAALAFASFCNAVSVIGSRGRSHALSRSMDDLNRARLRSNPMVLVSLSPDQWDEEFSRRYLQSSFTIQRLGSL